MTNDKRKRRTQTQNLFQADLLAFYLMEAGTFEFQVRQRAIKTIVRAFCPNLKTVTHYSLEKLAYLLGFEDVQGP